MYCRPIFILVGFLFLFANGYCQTAPDTSTVRALHGKAYFFWNTHPDSLRIYRDSSYHIALALNDKIGMGDSFMDLGIYHWVKGNYADAIHAYDTAIQFFRQLNKPDKVAVTFSNLGMVYSGLGDYPKAINYFLESLRLMEGLSIISKQASTYNSLGVAYKAYGKIDDAFVAYNRSLELFKEANNQLSVAGAYTNIGNVYSIKGDREKALQYQLKGLHIFDSLQSFKGQATCYNNISDIYIATGKVEEALEHSLHAYEISHKQGFFSNEVVALSGLAIIHSKLGKFKESEKYYLQGIAIAKERNFRSELVNLYKGISNCYKQLNKKDEALAYFEQHAALKDSLFNQKTLTTVANLQTAYELERKEASIQLLKKDSEIAKLASNRIILISIGLLLIAALVVARQRLKIKKDRVLMEHRDKLHETQQALTKLELSNSIQKENELLKELEYKNKSLTTYALSIVQKNEMMEEVRNSVEVILKAPDNQAEQFKRLSRLVDYSFTLDKDWEDFKLYFEDVHQDFFTRLSERYPDLTGADFKLCALVRLNLNMKQAAAILRISPDSVKVARHRLRKKFNMNTEENLTSFIASL
jgi:tetratricopeptide (TPR) repeat protein